MASNSNPRDLHLRRERSWVLMAEGCFPRLLQPWGVAHSATPSRTDALGVASWESTKTLVAHRT